MLRIKLFLVIVSLGYATAQDLATHPPRLDGRIVGGEETSIEDHPYQVSVLHYGFHTCGGTLLDKRFVITAAHCVYDISVTTLSVRLGSSIRNLGGTITKVASKHEHPKFNTTTMDSDIAVLRLLDPVNQWTDAIRTIDRLGKDVAEGRATVTGWGATDEHADPSTVLQAVNLDLIERNVCRAQYGDTLSETMICAGNMRGGQDACQGDSGGPLVAKGEDDGAMVLVGVVSWGFGCARPKYPGVYASVEQLGDWVMGVVVASGKP